MAESQSKIDPAAEKAFAEAAEKKTAAVAAAKPAPAEPEATAPAVKTEGASKPAAATGVAKQAAPKKAVKKAAARQAVRKTAVRKAATPGARKTPARQLVARAARNKVTSANTTITHLKDKIMATTKTTDFTKTAQDAVGELQGRAKAAYENGAEMTADATAFTKGNFDALVESGKILAAGMQDLGRTAVADAKSAAETATADVKALAAVKSPTELLQLQGEIMRRNLDTIVARTSKNAEVMMKLANDMFAPISTRASVAMQGLTKAA